MIDLTEQTEIWHKAAEDFRCMFNEDAVFIERLMHAFDMQVVEYGEPYCPCRVPPYTADDICPCSRLAEMLEKRGRCHCNLFVRRER